jgi:hypothetical protein
MMMEYQNNVKLVKKNARPAKMEMNAFYYMYASHNVISVW